MTILPQVNKTFNGRVAVISSSLLFHLSLGITVSFYCLVSSLSSDSVSPESGFLSAASAQHTHYLHRQEEFFWPPHAQNSPPLLKSAVMTNHV